jgi:hypothetical protein
VSVESSAERNLLAAVTRQAILDALSGDGEAAQWLECHSLPLFEYLAPEYMSGAELRRMLFKHLTDEKKAKRLYHSLRAPESHRPAPERRLCPNCGAVLVEDACRFC